VKTCNVCGETKPLPDFVPRKEARDGYRGTCRVCWRERTRLASQRWRERHPEQAAESYRNWLEKNREYDRERCNRYDATNREKRRQARAKSRKENPEHHRALNKAWREANIEKARAACLAYYHRKRSSSDLDKSTDAYVAWLMLQNCFYCGAKGKMTIDHVIPISRGGKHVADNIVPACQSCNSSKGAKPLEEWHGRAA